MASRGNDTRAALRRWARLLTFRATREELAAWTNTDLLLGLAGTWLVGMGRWWDDPGASPWQHVGLGSLVYVFVLAALLWAVIAPLQPQDWRYSHVLTFVALTSLPGLVYAVPVERFYDLATARSWNVYFLAVVAAWRVALLWFYMARHARLERPRTTVGCLLPLSAIVATLTALNLERAVFEVMGGLSDNPTAADDAYAVLVLLSGLAYVSFVPLTVGYLLLVLSDYRAGRRTHPTAQILALTLGSLVLLVLLVWLLGAYFS